MVILRYALTFDDHFQLNNHRFWVSKANRKWRIRQYLGGVFFVICIFLSMHLIVRAPLTLIEGILWLLLLVAFCFMVPELSRQTMRKNLKKLLRDPKNASYISPTEMSISETGIMERDEFSESRYDWKAFKMFEETKDYYYFFLDDLRVLCIPKKAFQSEEEKKEFVGYIARNISIETAFQNL